MLTYTVSKDGFPVVHWQPRQATETGAMKEFLLPGGDAQARIPENMQAAIYQSVLLLIHHDEVNGIDLKEGWAVEVEEL